MTRRPLVYILFASIVTIVMLWLVPRLFTKHEDPYRFEPTTLPPDEVWPEFRKALRSRNPREFEKWVLEISHRRLLENLSPDEIKEKLGSPSSVRRTTRDPMKIPSLGPRRILEKTVDYWSYTLFDHTLNEIWSFDLGVDTPFLKTDKLLWSLYTHKMEDGRVLLRKFFVDYCGEFREYENRFVKNP